MYYTDSGSGSEIILFVHGLLFDQNMFRYQVEYFVQKGYRCIAYDLRGQGKSQVTAGRYDIEMLYNDTVELIKQLNIAPVHFTGISMGGFIGMRIAARNPVLLKSLILLETSADKEPHKLKYKLLVLIVKLFGTRPVTGPLMNVMLGKSFLNDKLKKAQREEIKNHFKNLPKTVIKSAEAVIYRAPVYDELASIKLPVLIIAGDEDKATVPYYAERIYKQIMASRLVYINKAGHSSCLEEPEQINTQIALFLDNTNFR